MKIMTVFLIRFFILGSSVWISGCESNTPYFEASNLDLSKYQVFGIQSSSPQGRPDQTFTLTLHDFHPYLDDLTYQWKVCLALDGTSTEGLTCLDEFLEIKLDEITPRITLDLSSQGIDLRRRIEQFTQRRYIEYLEANSAGGALANLGGQPATVSEGGQQDGGQLFADDQDILSFESFIQFYYPMLNLNQGMTLYVIAQSGAIKEGLITTVKRLHLLDLEGALPLSYNPTIQSWPLYETEVRYPFPVCQSETPNRLDQTSNIKLRETILAETISKKECSFHEGALLNVDVELTPSSYVSINKTQNDQGQMVSILEQKSTNPQKLEYSWYLVGQHARPPFTQGQSVGHFPLIKRVGPTELIITVRDGRGGFAIARHQFTLVANQNIIF